MQLFEPIVPPEQWHPNFTHLMKKANGYVMDVLTDWARGFVDRDGKFLREFQTTFNPCFWELYLHAVLKHYKMQVDFSHAAPDFVVPGHGFNIEAVTASNAVDGKPEYEMSVEGLPRQFREFNRRAIIRVANSLVAKNRKFQESYAALRHVAGRPFVVAVNSFDQPFSFMACQRAIEAVLFAYYVDEDAYDSRGPDTQRLEGEELLQVLKDNGSPIELGFFKREEFADISAVIFNSTATIGKVTALSSDPNEHSYFTALRSNSQSVKPTIIQQNKNAYHEHLLDGLRIYHNPYARHPLDPAIFRNPLVFQSYWNGEEEMVEQRDGLLLFRSLISVIPEKEQVGLSEP